VPPADEFLLTPAKPSGSLMRFRDGKPWNRRAGPAMGLGYKILYSSQGANLSDCRADEPLVLAIYLGPLGK
jgi:hypothetical protein